MELKRMSNQQHLEAVSRILAQCAVFAVAQTVGDAEFMVAEMMAASRYSERREPRKNMRFTTLQVALAGNEALPKVSTTIIDKAQLNTQTLRLRLRPESPFEFQAGQFINLHRPDGLIRSYSIASLPGEGVIELHIELLANGQMSHWLHDKTSPGNGVAAN